MPRFPIYQMTFAKDLRGDIGLVFPSEQREYDDQSVIFVVSRYPGIDGPYPNDNTFYFPILRDGEYMELDAKLYDYENELAFSIPGATYEVSFFADRDSWFNYVGNEQRFSRELNYYCNLIPIDLAEMDELYYEENLVFVGLTPEFDRSADNQTFSADFL